MASNKSSNDSYEKQLEPLEHQVQPQLETHKKAKYDFFGMLDDGILSLIFLFSGGKVKDLVQLDRVNKRFHDLLNKDSSLLMTICQNLLLSNGHDDLHQLWEQEHKEHQTEVPFSLESLGLYQASVESSIFDKDAFRQKEKLAKDRAPQAALRIHALVNLMEKFPQPKSAYETSPQCCVFAFIVNFMVQQRIIPTVDSFDPSEHVNIVMHGGRRKYRENPIYREYYSSVPANLFRSKAPWAVAHILNTLSLHLFYLIVPDPTMSRRRRNR